MGGPGSTRWAGYRKKRTVEACQRVRATDYGGAPVASIPTPDGWQMVRLTAIPAYFGGQQYFWLCPACGHRVLLLYRPPGARRYLCRQCHALTYRSTQERRRPG